MFTGDLRRGPRPSSELQTAAIQGLDHPGGRRLDRLSPSCAASPSRGAVVGAPRRRTRDVAPHTVVAVPARVLLPGEAPIDR